jgi:hypothetical protein
MTTSTVRLPPMVLLRGPVRRREDVPVPGDVAARIAAALAAEAGSGGDRRDGEG